MKTTLEHMIKGLVDFPEEVLIKEVETANASVFELRMRKSDIGKVVGKEGRTIQSIRTIIAGIGGKEGRRARVEIVEEEA